MPGTSLKSAFDDAQVKLHDELWFYHEGNRALRQGDWKIVHSNDSRPFPYASSDAAGAELTTTADWSLYNLATDRGEQHDLSDQYPERAQAMSARWWQMRDEFLRDASQPGN